MIDHRLVHRADHRVDHRLAHWLAHRLAHRRIALVHALLDRLHLIRIVLAEALGEREQLGGRCGDREHVVHDRVRLRVCDDEETARERLQVVEILVSVQAVDVDDHEILLDHRHVHLERFVEVLGLRQVRQCGDHLRPALAQQLVTLFVAYPQQVAAFAHHAQVERLLTGPRIVAVHGVREGRLLVVQVEQRLTVVRIEQAEVFLDERVHERFGILRYAVVLCGWEEGELEGVGLGVNWTEEIGLGVN